ncbi:pyridoxal phosphate synthase yaaE subunit [Hydrogenispora ethanolica]|jgi:5'-phosphate synthase pdxT subunit|uniref:Pyridoxal 5'-phosphate synthase subunit PdxT n=1 Tax=Hydrogenispora ethanolica TaxID=1082276 RepID=A0A4R1RU28_HYDET|nr:pyridoxal 5'-phosphate synthase glutaminase subunit PdxT [Hydrogenispora ethanolica]TCL70058.1 pyridoxal phosphate synthase yaaE subunit [Hydrogenispora ethanolica]
MKIGVLALQGAVREHSNAIRACGAEPVEVRYPEQFAEVAGLIIPGGESTTVGKLLIRYQMLEPLAKLGGAGFPIFGTCTGLILLAREIIGSDQPRLGLMDITVNRNAFGRQIASFEADLPVTEIGPPDFHTIFIRAPFITAAGPGVQVLARLDEKILMARQGNLLAAAFHPELTGDLRIHQYFLKLCRK